MLQRVAQVTSEAARGNLEPCILHCGESERFAELAHSVNHLLDMTDAFLREVGADANEHGRQ